jgi:hypothetical protein
MTWAGLINYRGGAGRQNALSAVSGQEHGVGREGHDFPGANNLVHPVVAGFPGEFVDQAENPGHRPTPGLLLGPAGQRFGHLVHENHFAARVGGDDPFADGAQSHPQALFLGG